MAETSNSYQRQGGHVNHSRQIDKGVSMSSLRYLPLRQDFVIILQVDVVNFLPLSKERELWPFMSITASEKRKYLNVSGIIGT